MRYTKWMGIALCTVGLAGCGDTLAEQGLLGAGAGVATAVVLDTNPLASAAAGAAANVAYCQAYPSRC